VGQQAGPEPFMVAMEGMGETAEAKVAAVVAEAMTVMEKHQVAEAQKDGGARASRSRRKSRAVARTTVGLEWEEEENLV
jgi:ferredoxin-NADP reductase